MTKQLHIKHYLVFLAIVGLLVIFSCEKDDPLVITGNIEGTINDIETNNVIQGTNVNLTTNGNSTFIEQSKTTGSDGKFSFKDLEAGSYKLSFKKEGYEVHYDGKAEIYHKESVSTGKNSAFKTYYLYRNRFLYIRRNYTGFRWLIASAFFVLISSPVHIIKHLLKKEKLHAKSIWNALIWNLSNSATQEPKNHSWHILPTLKID